MNQYAVVVRVNTVVCCWADNAQQATRKALDELADDEPEVIDCVKIL